MTPCSVYFIEAPDAGLVKIGRAACAFRRFHNLRGASPVPLVLLGVITSDAADALEAQLHLRFAAHRAHGEWFRKSPELLDFIAENAEPPPNKRRVTTTDAAEAALKKVRERSRRAVARRERTRARRLTPLPA